LLVDPAYHANVGDHMITVGELEFLKGRHINQCSYVQARDYVPRCDDVLSQSRNNNATIAVWHGGDNWGDLWRAAQEPRIESFAPLLSAGYTIVSMPQSLYYVDDDALQKEDTQRIAGAISRGLLKHTTDDHLEDIAAYLKTGKDRQMASKRVVFTWRERESYDRAVELYPFATNKLVPDMAFQLGPYAPMIRDDEPRTDLVLLLRSDHESVVASQRSRESIRKILRSTPGGESLTFSVVDWEDRLERFESDDFFFTNTSIQLLSAGRVVVCDRLHAAILAYLVGLPFVFVDQVSGKITKTFEVAFDGEQSCQDGEAAMWARATNLTSAIAQSAGFLVKYQLQGNQRRRRRSVSAR
jgi:exopolysaccharide biosynthesis predicted pyruvyltransferase EpsI